MLPTRQGGFQNRDKVYLWSKCKTNLSYTSPACKTSKEEKLSKGLHRLSKRQPSYVSPIFDPVYSSTITWWVLKTACACLYDVPYGCADNNWPLLQLQNEARREIFATLPSVESFRFTRMVIHNGVILQYSYYFSLVWHTLIFLPYSWFYETKFLEKKRKAKVGIKRATNGPAAIFSCLRSPVGFLQENGFIYQIVSKVPLLEISVIQE